MPQPLNKTVKKTLVIHPFLFALTPILSLYQNNFAEVIPAQVLGPAVFMLVLTLILFLVLTILLRNVRKAGLVISLATFPAFLNYTIAYFLSKFLRSDYMNVAFYAAIASVLICVFVFYLIITSRAKFCVVTIFTNIMSICLVVIMAVNLIFLGLQARRNARGFHVFQSMDENYTSLKKPQGTTQLPDIYYIILDRYAASDVLRDLYGFDNTEFISYLVDKGFYVVPDARANYPKTAHSLASSLNMSHLNGCEDVSKGDKWRPLFSALQNHKVQRLLKSIGYKYYHLGSFWGPTHKNLNADENINLSWMSDFSWALYETSALFPILSRFTSLDRCFEKRDRLLYQFDKLTEMPKIKTPTFVLAHISLPHPPFIFDKNGDFIDRFEQYKIPRKEKYVDQLIFANKKVKCLIDHLIADSEIPPIIILQADEGPFPAEYIADEATFNWHTATEEQMREKLGILNAYYFPTVDNSVLYPSITPVNSFRLVFNLYFNTNYELLPDKTYVYEDYKGLYNFLDVTDRIRHKPE